MKDAEFIELLNLYLDHEISAADAARLEAEVQGNLPRRALYNQYCRMQKACCSLGADFRAENEVAFDPAIAAVERARRRRQTAYYGFGTFAAAAACVAFILVGRGRPAVNEAAGNRPAEIATVATPASTPATVTATRPGGIVQRPMMVADPLLLSGRNRSEAEFAMVVHETPESLAWIQGVQLAPLQLGVAAADLRFDAAPATLLRPEARALVTLPTTAEKSVEKTAFRFEK